MDAALTERWLTPDGLRRRERLVALGLRGPWREVLVGFPGVGALDPAVGDLRGIDLTQEELPGADLVRARLDGARLDDCGLIEARLDLATLSEASLTWARMDRASLLGCVALGASWDDASLEGAVLTASNLTRGSFRRTRLRGALLTATTLLKADLRCADLRGTEISCCDMEEARVAGVRTDRPRTYARETWNQATIRALLGSGYPSFLDAILLWPGPMSFRGLTQGAEVLRNVEAGVEASPGVDAEILALFQDEPYPLHWVGAVAMLIGGARKETLDALWSRLDKGRVAHPQLVVVALLVDPAFEAKARTRLDAPSRLGPEVLANLAWALSQRTGHAVNPSATTRTCQRWFDSLRKQMDPRIQAQWIPLAGQ
ncbi:pentapeptide repeat-containing protein [Corallococcus sp. bb12-1]|uniref:pentapeptide repeat-containing protein n=1 Tax=Corallococcus sp. bb12-1 TaxID=2996784 RepID=UPI00226E8F8E|nr:pentapeptide repeat-containing protein [Corallococcus sp. bb12-1]MCY1042980.1 pentapeptide repeat-containing protein [Corallococcus sp. bb12-1]